MSLKQNTLYNLLGNGLPLVAAAITIPYLLNKLGNEQFGVLSLIWALIGYFGVFDFGVGRALTYEVSRNVQSVGKEKIDKIIKAGLVLTVLTGILGAGIIYFLIAPHASTWFKLSPAIYSTARNVFEITALGIIPTTLTSGLRGALEGFQRFLESNTNRLILGTMMFAVPAFVVWVEGPNLQLVTVGLVATRFLVCALALLQLRKHLRGSFKISGQDIKPLMNFGVWVTVSGLLSPLMVYGDRFFVSAAVGAQALPLYAIPQEGLQRLLIVPAALTAALLPRLAATREPMDLQILYRQNIRRIAVTMFFVLLCASLLAAPILKIWISEDFATKTSMIIVVLCVGLWFNSMAQMSITLLHSIGKPKLAAVAHMIELPLYIGAVILLTSMFGVLGAALAWTGRVMLDFFIFNYFAKTSLK